MFIEIRDRSGRNASSVGGFRGKPLYEGVTDAEWAQFEAYVWAYVRQQQARDLDGALITPETHQFCHNSTTMWIQPKSKRGRPKKST